MSVYLLGQGELVYEGERFLQAGKGRLCNCVNSAIKASTQPEWDEPVSLHTVGLRSSRLVLARPGSFTRTDKEAKAHGPTWISAH